MPTSGTNKDTTPNAAAGLLTKKQKHPKDETETLYLGLLGSKNKSNTTTFSKLVVRVVWN